MNYAAMMRTVFILFHILSPMLTTLTGLLSALLTHCKNESNGLKCSLFDAIAKKNLK